MQSFPEAIFFDLDGTLIDSLPDLAAAIDAMLIELSLPAAGEEKVACWIGNGVQKLIERALNFAVTDESSALALYSKAKTIFDRVYTKHCEQASGLYPHTRELIEWCQQKGLPMALITNKPEQFTRQILKGLNLDKLFSVVVGGDTLQEKKPSAMGLIHSAKALSVRLENCWMVGDSKSDILAAKNAGCMAIGVTYGYNHGQPISNENPDWQYDSLKGLHDRLITLYSQASVAI